MSHVRGDGTNVYSVYFTEMMDTLMYEANITSNSLSSIDSIYAGHKIIRKFCFDIVQIVEEEDDFLKVIEDENCDIGFACGDLISAAEDSLISADERNDFWLKVEVKHIINFGDNNIYCLKNNILESFMTTNCNVFQAHQEQLPGTGYKLYMGWPGKEGNLKASLTLNPLSRMKPL